MSRRRNKKRRKKRKERSEVAAQRAAQWVKKTPGRMSRKFVAKGRKGDAAELRLTFGDTPFRYDRETGELKL